MKQELRNQALALRSQLSADQRYLKSVAAVNRVKSLPAYRQAGTVMLYLNFRDEVETTILVEDALASGKRVVVPLCNRDRTITPMEIANLQDDLQFGTWGIREPKTDRCSPIDPAEIDLVLVPGVAFDLKGNRLGYGAGYYDRFIPLLRPGVPLAALAFEVQILPDMRPEAHDRSMNMVITEDRIINC